MFIWRKNHERLLRAYETQKQELEKLREAHLIIAWENAVNVPKGVNKIKDRLKDKQNELELTAKALTRKREELRKKDEYIYKLKGLLSGITSEENTSSDNCNKIKCCDEYEAQSFAIQVMMKKGDGELFEAYECKKCPINRRTKELYWHIAHKDPKKRGRYYG